MYRITHIYSSVISFLFLAVFAMRLNAADMAGTATLNYHEIDSLTGRAEPLSPELGTGVGSYARKGAVGQNTFVFSEVDEYLKSYTAAPPPGDDDLAEILVEIGTGNKSAKIKKARAVIDKAINAGNFISQLTGGDLVSLPLALKKDMGNIPITVVFNSVVLKPQYAELEIFVKVVIPQKSYPQGTPGAAPNATTELFFGATGIKFSQDGGFVGDVRLELLEKVAFELGNNGNKKTALVLYPTGTGGGTYVTLDCDGLKEFGIEGGVFFSRNWVIPVDEFNQDISVSPEGNTARVVGHFQAIVQDWNDMLFQDISISNFRLADKDDFYFELGSANVDISDYSNPPSVSFPDDYLSDLGGDPNFWKGVYIEKLKITLPKMFKKRCDSYEEQGNSGQPCGIIIQAQNLIMDQQGVTGRFRIIGQAPLVGGAQLDKAWNWSLDEINLSIYKSDFAGFGFKGQIVIPIMSQATPVGYTAEYIKLPAPRYEFDLGLTEPGTSLVFPMFKAGQVEINQGTHINVQTDPSGDEFIAEVHLYGSMVIGHPNADPGAEKQVKLPGVTFEDLILRTRGKLIEVAGQIEVNTSGSKVMNFPVFANEFTFDPRGEDKCALGFTVGLNLIEEIQGGLAASGKFFIVGKLTKDGNGSHRWIFDSFEFTGAAFDLKIPKAMHIYGVVNIFKEHPVYGDGFGANANGAFIAQKDDFSDAQFKASVAVMFGNKDGYRYFMVDGFVSSSSWSVPLPPTPYFLNGFGGGCSYHMKPVGYASDPSKLLPGQDATGLIYAPSASTGLGIKIAASFTDKASTEGILTCVVRFSPDMRLQNIMFWGVVDIMMNKQQGATPPAADENAGIKDAQKDIGELSEADKAQKDKEKAKNKPDQVSAHLGISLDFEDGFTFHGFAEVYINMPSAKMVGHGAMDLLIETGSDAEWHLYVGGYHDGSILYDDFFSGDKVSLTPVSVAIQYADNISVSAQAYFLTGNKIPGPPPLAPAVAAMFEPSSGSSGNNNRALLNSGCNGGTPANGLGFAFGAQANFKISIEKNLDSKFCFKKVKLNAEGGVGFDLAMLKYPESSACADGTSPHGIHGFRATGNIWAVVGIYGSRVFCIPVPNLGSGWLVSADIVKPSSFSIHAFFFLAGKKLVFSKTLGDPCGQPCN